MTTTRVAVYYRNSRDSQAESIERQQSQVLPHCDRQGYTIVADIRDEGIAGSETAKRDGLQQLIAAARRKEFDGIVVDDLKRLARLDSWDAVEKVLNPLRKAGVWLETVARGRMSYDKAGRLLLALESDAGNEQLRDASRTILTKLIQNPPLPRTPYGYKREPTGEFRRRQGSLTPILRVVPDPVRAEIVKQMFAWFVSGRTPGWIAGELRRRGILSPAGVTNWRRSSIRYILTSEAYVGRRVWGRATHGKFSRLREGKIVEGDGVKRKEHRPKSEWQVAHNAFPPLVDEDTWHKAQEMLKRRSCGGAPTTPTAEPGAFVLSKLLVCDNCNSIMTGHRPPRGRRRVVYKCTRYMAHGPVHCVSCPVDEQWAIDATLTFVRKLRVADRMDALRAKMDKKREECRSEENLKKLRDDVAVEADRVAKYTRRLMEVDRDLLPTAQTALREAQEAERLAVEALRAAESADPGLLLERAVLDAERPLWEIEAAVEGGDRVELSRVLHEHIHGVNIYPDPYRTKSGALRHTPELAGLYLRESSPLAKLVDVVYDLDATL